MFRASEKSKFYLGGGIGYATLSFDVVTYDQYKIKRTASTTVGDFGGKAFLGYGMFRVSVISPSVQAIGSGGLVTVGFYTNPFR